MVGGWAIPWAVEVKDFLGGTKKNKIDHWGIGKNNVFIWVGWVGTTEPPGLSRHFGGE